MSWVIVGCADLLAGIGDDAAAPDPGDTEDTAAGPSDGGDEVGAEGEGEVEGEDDGLALGKGYFIAVHADPGAAFPSELINLETMVGMADDAGIKLTLMFTPPWPAQILSRPRFSSAMDTWAESGHEFAAHHHSVYHPGLWDGYTDFDEATAKGILGTKFDSARLKHGLTGEDYRLGSLAEWTTEVQRLNPDVRSGCANAERDKRVLPGVIETDTCPGFNTNSAYAVGSRNEGGSDPLVGANEILLVSPDDSTRFLGHSIISSMFIDGATEAFDALEAGVYGVIVHTKDHDVTSLSNWLAHLIAHDAGAGSLTVSEAAAFGLPERQIEASVYDAVYEE